MTYDDVLKAFGGTQVKVAAALGCTQSYVSKWQATGVPLHWQLVAEAVSNRAVLADRSLLPTEFRQ